MEIVKSMLGGLIGGAIGAVVANMIQSISGFSSPWFLLITGLGTGLGVRAAAGMNRSFVTGVIGAVTTVVVLLGSSVATSMAEVRAKAKEVAITKIESTDEPVLDEGSETAEPAADEAATDEPAADDSAADEPAADSEPEAGEDAETSETDSGDAAEFDNATEAEEGDDWGDPADEEAARAATAAASAATAPPAATADAEASNPAVDQLKKQTGWSVMDFLFNGVSALLAFAIASGSGSNASKSEPAAGSKD
jgi:hypothetical protein